jgi:hypothetical protein
MRDHPYGETYSQPAAWRLVLLFSLTYPNPPRKFAVLSGRNAAHPTKLGAFDRDLLYRYDAPLMQF